MVSNDMLRLGINSDLDCVIADYLEFLGSVLLFLSYVHSRSKLRPNSCLSLEATSHFGQIH